MPNKLSQFWHELNRRKVLKVVAMYAGGAYVLIELISNIAEPLNLPGWIPRLLIILALAGFPLVAILSWIFDITPDGIRKTSSGIEEADEEEEAVQRRRAIKLSDIVILVLAIAVCILLYPKIFKPDKFTDIRDDDRRISVVVMPFKNLTADTTFNIWQTGLQNLLITSLTNSEGLSIRQEAVTNGAIGRENQISYSSLEPSFSKEIAVRLKANTVITGNIYRAGGHFRITSVLTNSRTGEMYKSFEVTSGEENDFFSVVDSMAHQIKDFLEIKSLEIKVPIELKDAFTSSADAYKLYLKGRNYHGSLNQTAAIEAYTEALKIDSNFVLPMLYLTYIMGDLGNTEECIMWANRAFNLVNKVPAEIQLHVRQVKAMVDKKPYEQIEYIKQYLKSFPYSTQQYYTLGWIYSNIHQWRMAIDALERGLELNEQIGNGYRLWVYYYTVLGSAYSEIGEYPKAKRVFEDGLHVWPDDPIIIFWEAVCAVSYGDTSVVRKCIYSIENESNTRGWPESEKLSWIASCYDQGGDVSTAKKLYSEAYQLFPNNSDLQSNYAKLLIINDIDTDQGIDLIQSLLSEFPNSYEYQYILGLALYKKGEYSHASELLNSSWKLRPTYDHEHYMVIQELEKIISAEHRPDSVEG